jgi:hypothetical protein
LRGGGEEERCNKPMLCKKRRCKPNKIRATSTQHCVTLLFCSPSRRNNVGENFRVMKIFSQREEKRKQVLYFQKSGFGELELCEFNFEGILQIMRIKLKAAQFVGRLSLSKHFHLSPTS